MLDIELLRSFVSVVDAGGFTRAGERVHRTQSTVSQQIKRLEESVGRPLLERNGKQAKLTEEGERLLSYARRILMLEQEARDVVSRPGTEGVLRLGIPEDFAAYRLTELVENMSRVRPNLRLNVRSGLSVLLGGLLERGELDIALLKRDIGTPGGIAAWPEDLHWVTSRKHKIDLDTDPVPLVVGEQGCLYRNRMVHALEAAGRPWRIAFWSPNLSGIHAALSAGLGLSLLPHGAVLPEQKIVEPARGFPTITNTEIALVAAANASPAVLRIAELLVEFCAPRGPGGRLTQPGRQRLAAKA
ncbi:MAG TPA: LysR substrate-binding domain-containing protein [Pseudolabrys sp.]|nr:LysR substrate-binding domain-containing protein [Pseudolabrys sp.]